jgi:hypothetical protein
MLLFGLDLLRVRLAELLVRARHSPLLWLWQTKACQQNLPCPSKLGLQQADQPKTPVFGLRDFRLVVGMIRECSQNVSFPTG